MKTILITAYAVNPYKGSEDGMGWNGILQVARHNHVIAVTRKNNRPDIEKYIKENECCIKDLNSISFLYYDWPKWTRWWKKGPLLSMIYFYMWQLGMPLFLWRKKAKFDVAHNFNFHNDWSPSFLWLLSKPFVWGPIGHHPKIPKEHLLKYGKSYYLKDRILWVVKNIFWHLDPFLWITKKKAIKILCMNSSVAQKLKLNEFKYEIIPSVAVENPVILSSEHKNKFTVMMAARMVPLKGFDVTIKAFSAFKNSLPVEDQEKVNLLLIGSGPQKEKLMKLSDMLDLKDNCTFISWINRDALLKLYQKASVFLFPSHEGAGMVVAEALSFGVPVLCYDNYGPGELVPLSSSLKVTMNGYDSEVDAYRTKLLELYYSSSLMNSESKMAKEHFNNWLHWNVRGNQYKNIYQDLFTYEQNISHSFA
ncbi:glycosyltransferase family 4 protein [Fulvivirga sediminis]|uniref:Glycosyltransferase n=1 Tax=Fulvivirga sediminis TaxID=2803949 RepID=A0A937K0V7_9BACT|nr:glycosyltransferase [Fulvivirga sediminis]MBL3656786.1 glycosyltransferase [Fulvivirga sediminis]